MSALPNPPPSASPSKDAVAASIAKAHRSADPSIAGIFRIEAPGQEANPDEPVKLLEVTPNTSISGIMPVGLTAHAPSGIIYASIIVEVHPSELENIKNGKLPLPSGWKINFNSPL